MKNMKNDADYYGRNLIKGHKSMEKDTELYLNKDKGPKYERLHQRDEYYEHIKDYYDKDDVDYSACDCNTCDCNTCDCNTCGCNGCGCNGCGCNACCCRPCYCDCPIREDCIKLLRARKQYAFMGYTPPTNTEETRTLLGATAENIIVGATGGIPLNTNYLVSGTDIVGTDPVNLRGEHVYWVDWNAVLRPVNGEVPVRAQLILDGVVVPGSGDVTDITQFIPCCVTLTGGAMVNVPQGEHQLEIQYIVAEEGVEIIKASMKITQLL